ncbi:hypothetical protein OH77DRAFT_652685 [Trametes cingulata]|nr:hypothetical protein OH77DRAFT_652685 [Trametes cingulata]
MATHAIEGQALSPSLSIHIFTLLPHKVHPLLTSPALSGRLSCDPPTAAVAQHLHTWAHHPNHRPHPTTEPGNRALPNSLQDRPELVPHFSGSPPCPPSPPRLLVSARLCMLRLLGPFEALCAASLVSLTALASVPPSLLSPCNLIHTVIFPAGVSRGVRGPSLPPSIVRKIKMGCAFSDHLQLAQSRLSRLVAAQRLAQHTVLRSALACTYLPP